MSIQQELIHILNDDRGFNLFLDSIDQKLDYHFHSPVNVQLSSEICQSSSQTSSYFINTELRLEGGQFISCTGVDSWLSQNLINHISLYSLELTLKKLRDKQSNIPVILAMNTDQLCDYTFIQNVISLILRHRFSFRNLKLELKASDTLPGNILALQRGYRLISSCGIQLGIVGFKAPIRLLCSLIHFNYIKLDGSQLIACHLDKTIQSQLASLHQMATYLGIELICCNLSGEEELEWLKKINYFQEEASQVLSKYPTGRVDINNRNQSANEQQLRPADFAS